MNILETERLLLRHPLLTDLDDLYALYSDSEMRRYFPDGTLTRQETLEELEWYLAGHPRHPELGLWARSTSRLAASSDAAGCCLGPSMANSRSRSPT